MPFIGRDWRSPGEAWVKTESLGWQRMKIIESQLQPACCYQSHNLACSWPPPSQAGQHMASNLSCGSAGQRGVETGASSAKTEQGNSCDDAQAEELSSESSSNETSASSSPISSPERSSGHHLHPITISSPYGRYSCCNHHLQPSPELLPCGSQGVPSSNRCAARRSQPTQMCRSLSRDSFDIRPSTKDSLASEESCTHALPCNSLSVRGATDQSGPTPIGINSNTAEQDIHLIVGPSAAADTNCRDDLRAPVILENGLELCDRGPRRASVDRDAQRVGSIGLKRSRSLSPHSQCCCRCDQQQPHTAQVAHNHLNPQQRQRTAPHCRISIRTREVAMYNTISEAFYRLDFYNAIHDIRRFNYICKLLHLLITQNLTSLSGCATRVLFTMLEQVAWEVSSNKRNIHVIRNLLDELNETIQKYYCWGRPIGSSVLWQQHFDTIERISRIVDEIELSQTIEKENQMTFDKLPIEMIREILLRLNDYRDLVNSAQASPVMRNMIDEQCIWRKLCRYHFTDQQLKLVFENSNYLNRVKRSALRGIKYARTVSADGKVSFRNPVLRKRPPNGRPTARAERRNSDHRQLDGAQSSGSSDSDGSQTETTSHVIKTIRIFDKKGSSTTLTGGAGSCPSASAQSASSNSSNRFGPTPKTAAAAGGSMQSSCAKSHESNETNRPDSDTDWELVFHQLRK